ncbi:sulfite exporter TauE/SafE family protein [Thermus scotoductus]|uniref:Probable membrane transporter protein n=1 Tax=Thermus scotoductus TaxID=37636 RepID=A0A0N0ZSN7_THESC|nr:MULTISPECIES: sulfite exporter TauE/SafE family protein [Thermus]ETN88974.1 permease [Thermus sp. NMX2.A1]KPD32319.1 permease [Thermus scotoductus]RTG93469.1 sulfite exporter TauE/SafE family protein [Thermus scotoductus]RTG99055.1 sulfite exporter TauE/SafE family protein [Thermus scotoductus]RTH00687.1 sulfite exporter TauE/SafE family protein [Thermus scotoductus]
MAFLLGFLIAFAIGITGVGAGTITAPLLILGLGLSPEIAVGTALLFGFLVKVPAGAVYLFRRQVAGRVLGLLLLGGLPGVLLGSLLLVHLKGAKDMVLLLVGLTVVVSAGLGLYRSLARLTLSRERPWLLPPAAFGIGLEVGFSSAGAGALGSLLLLYATRLTPQQVVGTDILFGLVLSLVGGGVHLHFGQVDPKLLLSLSLGGIVGASLGALVATRVPKQPFRVALLLWLLFIGAQLVWRGVAHG